MLFYNLQGPGLSVLVAFEVSKFRNLEIFNSVRSKLKKRKNLSIYTNFKTERYSPPPPPPTTDILTSLCDPSYFLTFEIVTFFIHKTFQILLSSFI